MKVSRSIISNLIIMAFVGLTVGASAASYPGWPLKDDLQAMLDYKPVDGKQIFWGQKLDSIKSSDGLIIEGSEYSVIPYGVETSGNGNCYRVWVHVKRTSSTPSVTSILEVSSVEDCEN